MNNLIRLHRPTIRVQAFSLGDLYMTDFFTIHGSSGLALIDLKFLSPSMAGRFCWCLHRFGIFSSQLTDTSIPTIVISNFLLIFSYERTFDSFLWKKSVQENMPLKVKISHTEIFTTERRTVVKKKEEDKNAKKILLSSMMGVHACQYNFLIIEALVPTCKNWILWKLHMHLLCKLRLL